MKNSAFLQIKSLIEAFSKRAVSKAVFIAELKKMEGQNWFFTFDEGRLLIRNNSFKLAMEIDELNGTYSTVKLESNVLAQKNYSELAKAKEIIAFSGTSRSLLDERGALSIINTTIQQYSPQKYAVLTGGYPQGVPHIAAKVAKKQGFQVIAVVPSVIHRTEFDSVAKDLYSDIIEVGQDWGDESDVFTDLASHLYFIGGGHWTEIEYLLALQKQKQIHFIKGFGGLSEKLSSHPQVEIPSTLIKVSNLTPNSVLSKLSISQQSEHLPLT